MATVRITQEIRDTAWNEANTMFSKRLADANTFWTDQTSLANRLISVQLETQGLDKVFAAMPREWKASSERLHVVEVNGFKPVHLSFLHVTPAVLTPPVAPYNTYKIRVTAPSLLEVADQWEAWERNITQLTKEKETFKTTVSAFFARHSTLRQATEEWPGCLELVSADVRERHETKVERTSSIALKPIDQSTLDDLNRHVVTAKILGEK